MNPNDRPNDRPQDRSTPNDPQGPGTPSTNAPKSHTVTAASYSWRGNTVTKGGAIDISNATPAELEQLDRDSQGPDAKLSR